MKVFYIDLVFVYIKIETWVEDGYRYIQVYWVKV